jgi:hypothetical protein
MGWDNGTQFHPPPFGGSVQSLKNIWGVVMPSSWKGIIAGLLATILLSLIILAFHTAGILPELDIVTLIDNLGSINRGQAWADHFIVGTLLWGPIFAGTDSMGPPTRPRWLKGLIFGAVTWFFMMIIFMPVVGGGLFGMKFGIVEPIGMLGMNLVYGLAIGIFYDLLDKQFPTRDLISSEPPLPEMAQFKDK